MKKIIQYIFIILVILILGTKTFIDVPISSFLGLLVLSLSNGSEDQNFNNSLSTIYNQFRVSIILY